MLKANKNAHIPDSEIKQDIGDTQGEINDYRDELRVLQRNPIENKVRIYVLGGRIGQRETFIKKLSDLLSSRSSTDETAPVEEILAQEWRTDEDDTEDVRPDPDQPTY